MNARASFRIRFGGGGYAPETFGTLKAAIAYHKREYLERNKGDGYDTYHRTRNVFFEKVTEKVVIAKIFIAKEG